MFGFRKPLMVGVIMGLMVVYLPPNLGGGGSTQVAIQYGAMAAVSYLVAEFLDQMWLGSML